MSTYRQFKDIDPTLFRGMLLGEDTTETTTDSQNEDGIMSRTTPSATPSTEQTGQEDLLVTTAQTMANASTDREALANAIVPPTPELRPQDFDIGEWETLRPIEDVLSSDPMYDMAKEDAQVQAAITSAKGITRSRTEPAGSGEVLTDVDPIKARGIPSVKETELALGAVEDPLEVPAFKSYNSPEEMSDLEILARTIEAEARGEPYKGKVAVGATIANRVASGSYGGKEGIKGVILRKGQFSPWNSYTGFAGGEQGKDMLNLKASQDSYKAANAILTGNYTDPTNGATHYVNESIAEGQSWIDTMKAREKGTVTIGNHLFGNADNNKVYDGRLAIMERSSETTDQPVVAQPPTVELVQRIVGAAADGAFGPNTRKKAEAYLSDAGVDIPKDATDEQIMDLVVNKPVYDQETVKKAKEAPTTAAALDITADAAAKKDPLLIKNPIQWIYEQPNLIGLKETSAEGQKTIVGFFDNSLGEGQKFYVRPEDAREGINYSVTSTAGAWCATFVDHVLTNLGVDRVQKTKDGAVKKEARVGATHYQTLGDGVDISETKAGDLAVFAGHVGFVVGKVEGVATSNVANARALQEGLTKAGFSTKGADGMWGPNSAAALTAYQKANNLPVTGNVTPELYKALTNKEGTTTYNVLVLGGNQNNSVNVSSYPATKIKHFRRVGPVQDLDKKTFDSVTEDIRKAGSLR